MHFRFPPRSIATLVLAAITSESAAGYVGPGAGGGGSAGMGWGAIIVIVIAAALGLCLLCGAVAIGISVADRARRWVSQRRADQAATDGEQQAKPAR